MACIFSCAALAAACGKAPTTSAKAAGVATTAALAASEAPASAPAVANAPIDPVPTGPAPGEKLPVALPPTDPAAPPVPSDSLTAALRAHQKASQARAPKETQALMQRAIDDIAASDVLRRAINMDAIAPDFTLPDATGKSVQLSALLKRGPVVLTWYRGGWCPYCNLTLRHYAKLTPQLTKAGATLVVVSPDTPDKSLSTKRKLALPMVVLSDVGLKVARRYGLVYRLPPAVKAMYDKAFHLKTWSGLDKGDLPLAAAYVIGQDGRVRYAFLDADYRRRAEPAELLAAVQARTPQAAK